MPTEPKIPAGEVLVLQSLIRSTDQGIASRILAKLDFGLTQDPTLKLCPPVEVAHQSRPDDRCSQTHQTEHPQVARQPHPAGTHGQSREDWHNRHDHD